MKGQQQNGENRIDRTMKIKGNVSFRGTAIIEGIIEGNITGETIIVTETATVLGDLVMENVDCRGKVTGTITTESLLIGPHAQIKGTLESTFLEVKPGAQLDCEINSGKLRPKKKEVDGDISLPLQGAEKISNKSEPDIKTKRAETVVTKGGRLEEPPVKKPSLHLSTSIDREGKNGFFTYGDRGKVTQSIIGVIRSSKELIKVVGDLGSGKSTVCQKVCEELSGSFKVVRLEKVVGSTREIYLRIAEKLSVAVDENLSQNDILKRLKEDLEARKQASERVLLILDNSHEMYPATLEGVIRNLSHSYSTVNNKLQIALFGDELLNKHLDPKAINYFVEHPECAFELRPLSQAETSAYIRFKLDEIQRCMNSDQPVDFPNDSMTRVYSLSQGLIGKINRIVEQAIELAGKKKHSKVATKFVKNI